MTTAYGQPEKSLISCGFARLDLFTSTCFCLSWCVTASMLSGVNGFWLRSKLYCKPCATEFDGTPCAVKAARTVWSRGKVGDYIKDLPMAIGCKVPGHEAAHERWRCHSHRYAADPSALWSVRLSTRDRRYSRHCSIISLQPSKNGCGNF